MFWSLAYTERFLKIVLDTFGLFVLLFGYADFSNGGCFMARKCDDASKSSGVLSGMLTSGDIARRLGVHRNTVLYWQRQGIITPEFVAPSGRSYYTEAQVQEWIHRSPCDDSGEGSSAES